jgi:hypothetical protein
MLRSTVGAGAVVVVRAVERVLVAGRNFQSAASESAAYANKTAAPNPKHSVIFRLEPVENLLEFSHTSRIDSNSIGPPTAVNGRFN